jgi:8-oxo-dGTP diphosphatase
MAGWWEFPGGKLETGEPARAALRRELGEELGIQVQAAYRLLRFSHPYPERRVHLDVWRVTRYAGTPKPHEGQSLAWASPERLGDWKLLPADEPIVAALKLPPLMLVTPEPGTDAAAFLSRLERSLEAGVDLVQFRAPDLEPAHYRDLAREVMARCRAAGTRVHLNASPALARELGADGVHLSQRALADLAPGGWDPALSTGISCHSREEIRRALQYRPDYLLLGPVNETGSHPGRKPLGWDGFSSLAAECKLPVYAIGGLGLGDLATAREQGGHGVAAIRGLWDLGQLSDGS